MPGLLDDVRVIELSGRLAGSFCAKLLADQGAQTLKIEPPGRGDQSRYEPPFLGEQPSANNSSLFLAYNTNKRGVTLDAATPSGRDLLLRLLADQDILIESYQPGELAAMGLSYDVLREINPRLIVASITPFGQTGPYRNYQGADLIAQAMGGFLFTTGTGDRPPMGTAWSRLRWWGRATPRSPLWRRSCGNATPDRASISTCRLWKRWSARRPILSTCTALAG